MRDLQRAVHQALRKVTSDYERFSYNTAVSALMELSNTLQRLRQSGGGATPEWREANGQVLMEAMANEVAVLGTDSGVIPELIGDAGLVVPAGDAPALANALDRLSDHATRRALAQTARARALRLYSDDAIAERTLEFWRQVSK